MPPDIKHPSGVAIIGFDPTLASLIKRIAAKFGSVVEEFGSLGEIAVKGHLHFLRILVIDMDSAPVTAKDLSDRVKLCASAPSVLLVGGAELAGRQAIPMPSCVKRIVVREGGWSAVARALQELLTVSSTASLAAQASTPIGGENG